MAYSELLWRPFLGHQAWSWTTLRKGNVFLLRLQTFFLFLSRFTFLKVFFKFLFERFFTSMIDSSQCRARKLTMITAQMELFDCSAGAGRLHSSKSVPQCVSIPIRKEPTNLVTSLEQLGVPTSCSLGLTPRTLESWPVSFLLTSWPAHIFFCFFF